MTSALLRDLRQDLNSHIGVEKGTASVCFVAHFAFKAQLLVHLQSAAVKLDRLLQAPSIAAAEISSGLLGNRKE
jgi:hypothetical protein